jgi:integrase
MISYIIEFLKPDKLKSLLYTITTSLTHRPYLQWAQIDMQRRVAWIHADQMKGKRDLAVPLNEDALEVLRQWIGRHHRYAFLWRDKPIAKCSTRAWYQACQRAGIEDFRWHDLRHTWASWHVQNGTP